MPENGWGTACATPTTASAVSPCSIKEQLPEEIGKGNIIHIKGVVRDVQATPVDKVEIYSTAQQQVIGVTDQNGKYFIDAPED